jgi:hypothetical protein
LHFLKDLLENPKDKDPVKNIPHVHKHLIRYSKGNFVGPAAKVRFSKMITIDGSFEFEDLFAWLASKLMISQNLKDEIQITGVILSDRDFSETLYEIGLDSWKVKKSTGKTKNFKCVLDTPVPISSTQLKELVEKLNSGSLCYLMFNFNTGTISLKTKKKPPRPKTKGDKTKVVTIGEKVKFTKLKLPNTDYMRDLIIDEIFPDFKDEITSLTKLIVLECSYDITDLILPPKERRKNSSSIRRFTLRKGTLERVCVIDKETYENKTEIVI